VTVTDADRSGRPVGIITTARMRKTRKKREWDGLGYIYVSKTAQISDRPPHFLIPYAIDKISEQHFERANLHSIHTQGPSAPAKVKMG
jgi:hypothetical protein